MRNNKITPIENENNFSSRSNPTSSQSNINLAIAGSTSLFCGAVCLGIVILSLSADQSFSKMNNRTSFAEEVGQDGKYGVAVAIATLTFLTTFVATRCFLENEDRRSMRNNFSANVVGDLVFSNGVHSDESPSGIVRRSDQLINPTLNPTLNQNHL